MLAPATSGMPASMQAGIRCVPISPLVESAADEEAPRQQQIVARAQPSRSAASASRTGFAVLGSTGLATSVSP